MSNRGLDAEVAECVMGFSVLGVASCDRDPDCGGLEVIPLSEVVRGTEFYPAEIHPVFMARCFCENYPIQHVEYPDGPMKRIEIEANARNVREHSMDLEKWGHSRSCLSIVPFYSTDIAAAMQVVENLARRMEVDYFPSADLPWCVMFVNAEGEAAWAASLPEAICCAALAVVKDQG